MTMTTLDNEERILNLEKKVADLLLANETLAELIGVYQQKIQRTITELTEHFALSIEPKVKRIVRDEIEQIKTEV